MRNILLWFLISGYCLVCFRAGIVIPIAASEDVKYYLNFNSSSDWEIFSSRYAFSHALTVLFALAMIFTCIISWIRNPYSSTTKHTLKFLIIGATSGFVTALAVSDMGS